MTQKTISEIRQLFENQGDSGCYGENISQYEHAAQAAILVEPIQLLYNIL